MTISCPLAAFVSTRFDAISSQTLKIQPAHSSSKYPLFEIYISKGKPRYELRFNINDTAWLFQLDTYVSDAIGKHTLQCCVFDLFERLAF